MIWEARRTVGQRKPPSCAGVKLHVDKMWINSPRFSVKVG